jgi:hypothetical protein
MGQTELDLVAEAGGMVQELLASTEGGGMSGWKAKARWFKRGRGRKTWERDIEGGPGT